MNPCPAVRVTHKLPNKGLHPYAKPAAGFGKVREWDRGKYDWFARLEKVAGF